VLTVQESGDLKVQECGEAQELSPRVCGKCRNLGYTRSAGKHRRVGKCGKCGKRLESAKIVISSAMESAGVSPKSPPHLS